MKGSSIDRVKRRMIDLAWRATLLSGFAIAGSVHIAIASSDAHVDDKAVSASPPFAIADFDGDSRPDVAKVLAASGTIAGENRYSIDFELTTGLKQRIAVSAPSGGVSLTSRDVNGDNFPDVVVTTAWTGSPVAVLINDGRGNFTSTDPSNFPRAFEASNHSVGSPRIADEDGAALVSPRPLPGECAAYETRSLIPDGPSRISQRRRCFSSLAGRNAFLGRAPPSFLS